MKKFFSIAKIVGISSALIGCTTPTYTNQELISMDQKYLASAISIKEADDSVKKTMDLFIQTFSAYKASEMEKVIPEMYTEDAFLNDRIHSIRGNVAIQQYF